MDNHEIVFEDYAFTMDEYFNEHKAVDRLVEEWEKHGKLIVAYDFDNTVFDYDKKGATYNQMIELLKTCKKLGCTMIVFTCRSFDQYDVVEEYLKDKGIPYDFINENDPSVEFETSRKIFYSIFFDDRAGIKSAYEIMVRTIERRLER